MKVEGRHYRTIWLGEDGRCVEVIDQTRLPHEFAVKRLANLADAAEAIVTMVVRGAPLIGVTAAYGVCLGLLADPSDTGLARAVEVLSKTRPTAVNLHWALARMAAAASTSSPIATPAGSRRSTGARPWRPSTWRTTRAFRSTSGSTRPGRETRALR
jgi:methylthioribose-1-phosphate isomerase